MSASDKKKLRKEANAAAMTEKQLAEAKEAKKLKAYTLTFVIAMVLVVVIVLGTVLTPVVMGVIHRNTKAVTVGNHTLSTADLSYFYIDEISQYYNDTYNEYSQTYQNMWQMFLYFNVGQPLNEQMYDSEKKVTWADHFMDLAYDSAKQLYSLYDDAVAKGFEMPEEEEKAVEQYMANMKNYAAYYGYSSASAYLRSTYGTGATMDTFREYYWKNRYVSAYFTKYVNDLEYTDEQLREFEKDKYDTYSSFTYSIYNVNVNKYLPEGTKDENGKTTYTDEQRAEALAAAKKDAEAIVAAAPTTTTTFDEAVKALAVNKDNKNAAGSHNEKIFYESIGMKDFQDWLADNARKEGDMTIIEGKETKENEDGTKTETVSSYYVLLFRGASDNLDKLITVRHILVAYKNPTYDANYNPQYSDASKKEAKDKAQALLDEWKAGAATIETFAELANKNSDDSDGTDGGQYVDVYPGQMVESFDKWCFDPARQAGDTAIVETEYGAHVMYFEKTQDNTYRDLLIEDDLITRDSEKWVDDLKKTYEVTILDLSGMELDYIVN